MIAANSWHAEDGQPKKKFNRKLFDKMPAAYKADYEEVARTNEGRKALRRYSSFTGLPFPPEIIRGPGKKILVGMGRSPEVQLADGDARSVHKIKRVKQSRKLAATDADGKRIYILNKSQRRDAGKKLRFAGYAPETHYVLTPGEEKAGTFKKGKYWIHSHSDEGGKWPKAYADQYGNLVYARGTYRVGKWIRRN
ncbi:MAG: hypothetical protein GZ088_09675 [Acidipila sp.]|nr:hypothetical protein [Acidipila sp.]